MTAKNIFIPIFILSYPLSKISNERLKKMSANRKNNADRLRN